MTGTDWRALAARAALPVFGLIDGKPTGASDGSVFACRNPATGERLADVASFTPGDVALAVRSARRTFQSGVWSRTAPARRKRLLTRLSDLILEHGDELALLDSLAMGKPVEIARNSDIPGAASFIRWYAECIDKLYDEVVPGEPDSFVVAIREPLGVVGLITPWNYPLEEAAIKLGPALAAGNCVVLKPSELAPFSAIRLGELAIEAGIPAGVLNIAPGLGGVTGRALALHEDVDGIGFTGSTAVGKLLMQYSGQSNLKRVWLECGGKSPNIVFADFPDLDEAARESARSVFRNQGQVCSAGSRLLVERSISEDFAARIVNLAAGFEPSDPLESGAVNGPIASPAQHRRILALIAAGEAEGARLVLDGRRHRRQLIGPTLFADVENDMRIAREEIFGPVICLITFDDEEEAVRIANDSMYGLVASVWTGDPGRAHRIARRLAAGSVTVNGVDAQSEAAPFGGYKQSGIGREHSLKAFDQYMNVKTIWINY